MTALQWLASLGLLGVAVSLMDWREIGAALLHFSPWMAVLIVLVLLAEFPLLALRWHLLSRRVVELPFSIQLFRYFGSQFFNSITPAQLGGDAYRFLTMRKSASTQGQLAAIIAQERLIGLAGYLTAFLVGALLFEATGGAAALSDIARDALRVTEVALLVALALMFTLPLFFGTVERASTRLGLRVPEGLMSNLQLAARIWEADNLPQVAGLTLAAIAGWCLAIWLVAADLQVAISIPAILVIGTLSELVRLVPFTVQGLGLREGAFAASFALSGHSPESGFVVGTIAYAALTLATLLIGVLGLLAMRGLQGRVSRGTPIR